VERLVLAGADRDKIGRNKQTPLEAARSEAMQRVLVRLGSTRWRGSGSSTAFARHGGREANVLSALDDQCRTTLEYADDSSHSAAVNIRQLAISDGARFWSASPKGLESAAAVSRSQAAFEAAQLVLDGAGPETTGRAAAERAEFVFSARGADEHTTQWLQASRSANGGPSLQLRQRCRPVGCDVQLR